MHLKKNAYEVPVTLAITLHPAMMLLGCTHPTSKKIRPLQCMIHLEVVVLERLVKPHLYIVMLDASKAPQDGWCQRLTK